RHAVIGPGQFVLPDSVTRNVGSISPFQYHFEGPEICIVKTLLVEGDSARLDLLVVVDVFENVEIDLAVVSVTTYELTAYCFHNSVDYAVNRCLEEERIAFRKIRRHKAKVVTKLSHRRTQRNPDVFCGQSVDG